jgi:hypothetical protein
MAGAGGRAGAAARRQGRDRLLLAGARTTDHNAFKIPLVQRTIDAAAGGSERQGMKFTTPATTNPIDQLKVVGKPHDRIDGPLKTTGTAPYAYEQHQAAPNAAYGYVVGAAIAKGRIVSIDPAPPRRPGVIAIVTYENAGKLGKGKFNTARLLGGTGIQHYHQAVALVVAETFEQARAAAAAWCGRVRQARAPTTWPRPRTARKSPKKDKPETKGRLRQRACRRAGQARRHLHHARPVARDDGAACLDRVWEGDKLTIFTSNQMVDWGMKDMAKTLGIPEENVRLVSPYIGGGFGGKLFLRSEALLAALGARAAKRPVKVTLQRAIMFNNTTHRPATIQRIRIGARAKGASGDRARELVGRPARTASRKRRSARPVAVRRRRTADRAAPGRARPAGRQRDARAGRGAGPDGARDRDGRDGGKAEDGPGHVPHRQRHQRRSGKARAQVLAAPPGRMPAPGRRALRLEQAQSARRARCATAAGWSAWAWPRPSATTW